MSILGAVVRVRPVDLDATAAALAGLPGTDVALNPGDGRLVLVIEDAEHDGQLHAAAATLARIAALPQVLNTSLVYEYSGPDAPAAAGVQDYRDWRRSLHEASHATPTPPHP